MTKGRETVNGGFLALSIVAMLAVMCLSIVPSQAAENNDVVSVMWMWTLPDSNMDGPGVQVAPMPNGSQPVEWWTIIEHGPLPLDSVWMDLYYPDGSFRTSVPAVEVTDSSVIETAIEKARLASLLSEAQVDAFRSGTFTVCAAMDGFGCTEPAGHYRVETWVASAGEPASLSFVNSFEYVGLASHQVDFDYVHFGSATAGSTVRGLGQNVSGSPSGSILSNVGNVPLIIDALATEMIGGESGESIPTMAMRFKAEEMLLIGGAPAVFSGLLMVGDSGSVSFSLDVPGIISPDSYMGDLTIGSSAAPCPVVDVLVPDVDDTWTMGDMHTVVWEAVASDGSPGDDLSMSIWFSPDGGSNWTSHIAGGIANTGSYDWSIPWDWALVSDQAVIRVVAIDAIGCYGSDASEAFLLPPPTM